MLLLVPLTALAMLGLFSVGIFMAPLVMIGWMVFALRNGTCIGASNLGRRLTKRTPVIRRKLTCMEGQSR